MKFLFTLSISLLVFSIAYSQAPLNVQTKEQSEIFSRTVSSSESGNRQFVSEWYNYGESISLLGGNVDYYRNYLFPDSTVVTEFSTGFSSVWKHSYGQMCDPSSPNLANNTLIDENAAYSMDSILLWYRYYRFQNQNPDTVIIQVYEDNKINFSEDPWTDDRSYGNVDYDTLTRKGKTPSFEYTILLGDNDTATASQHGILIPVGINIAAGKKAAATVTYFPGNPVMPGDTIDPVTTATVVNKINAFAIYDYKDLDKTQNKYFYNNGMTATSDIRYNMSTNGWNGQYIAGNAYSSGYYHLDMAFKLTSNEVGINEKQISDFSINLFPSLVTEDENSLLQIQSAVNGKAVIQIFDLSGKNVFETIAAINTGTTKIGLSVGEMAKGVYFVNVDLNGMKQTVKLVKL